MGSSGNHGHVNGDAIASFQPGEIAQHGGDFIHAAVKFLIGDYRGWILPSGSGTKMSAALFLYLLEMPVDAVVAGIQFAADKPLPERRLVGVQRGVPILVPVQAGSAYSRKHSGKCFSLNFSTMAGSFRLAWPMNFAGGWKYSSSFQWTAICASVSLRSPHGFRLFWTVFAFLGVLRELWPRYELP